MISLPESIFDITNDIRINTYTAYTKVEAYLRSKLNIIEIPSAESCTLANIPIGLTKEVSIKTDMSTYRREEIFYIGEHVIMQTLLTIDNEGRITLDIRD